MAQTFFAEKLFTGSEWLYNHEITVENGVVQSLLPSATRTLVTADTDTFWAPAFVDFQVYGAAGKLFSAHPSPETLRTMQETFAAGGTCLFQPTVATNQPQVYRRAVDAVRQYWSEGGTCVHGLHLEGPWINHEKRGAHVESFVQRPTAEGVRELLEYGKDVIKTVTLAPEVCDDGLLGIVQSYGVTISAGHSNATCKQAAESFGKGITAVTHLYNAMSPLHHRQPGLVGAAFNHPFVAASVIPDGHHVDYTAVAVAKKLMGERLFAITDAVAETDAGPYQHYRVGDKYECNGTLSGSALSMHGCFRNLVSEVGIEVDEALRMCGLYPARVMGVDYLYGKVAPGFAAAFVVLNKDLSLAEAVTETAASR